METDPQDNLALSEVGEWTLEKHERLRRYIDISRKVRQKFTSPGKAGATFIDLYCGPGRSRLAGTDKVIDGSPVVAYEAARTAPFTSLHLADVEEVNCDAALARIRARGGDAKIYVGPAEETVDRVCVSLDPYALHFAFLDPFSLAALPISVIRRLSHFKRMDMLIHVSAMDFQRNLGEFVSGNNLAMDRFAPGWRNKVNVNQPKATVRREIREYWLGLIRSLDMTPAQGIELVTGPKNQNLYWLVFVARHERAQEFWEKIRDINPQRGLF
jgi:three-Cys-motif partner protein